MPLCGDLDGNLVVKSSNLKHILMEAKNCQHKYKCPPFSKLKLLTIADIDESQPPKQWLHNLTSLERLDIRNYKKLKSLHEGFSHMGSLKHLTVEKCNELDLMKKNLNPDAWGGLKSLRSLTLKGIPKLQSLPKGLVQHVTTLEELYLDDCSDLGSLSDNIDKLVSLHTLEIFACHALGRPPTSLANLKSLRTLRSDDPSFDPLIKQIKKRSSESLSNT